jgi:hypothetical protein
MFDDPCKSDKNVTSALLDLCCVKQKVLVMAQSYRNMLPRDNEILYYIIYLKK